MSLHPDLRLALRTLKLDGDTARFGPHSRRAEDPTQLADAARELLYEFFYLHPRRRPPPVSDATQSTFVEALVAAHRSPHGYEGGWRQIGEERGLAVLQRNGLRVWAPRDAVAADGRLRVPPVQRGMLSGYVIALSSTPPPPDTDAHTVRLYWNLHHDGAARWLGAVSGALEAGKLAYRIKLLNSPAAYWRADAAVIYLDRRDSNEALEVLLPVHKALRAALFAATPRFTERLGPGLARADEPPGDDSFGESRCRLVVEACMTGSSISDRIAALIDLMQRRELDPARPWIQP